jgi:hypothetical protein
MHEDQIEILLLKVEISKVGHARSRVVSVLIGQVLCDVAFYRIV